MKTRKRFWSITLAICIVIMISTSIIASANTLSPVGCIAYVTADTLNLRQAPQGKILSKARRNQAVTILSERDRNGYYHIRLENGNEYYAYGDYLRIDYSSTAYSTPVTTLPGFSKGDILVSTVNSLNLRKKPSKNAYRIIYVNAGDQLEIMKGTTKNNYILVKHLNSGKVGYVDINFTIPLESYTPVTTNSMVKCTCCPNCNAYILP